MAVQTLTSVAANLPPVEVTFTAIGHEETYFRSLYLRAELSPLLLALHEAGRRAWALDPSPYMPHLSLLYSDTPAECKQAIIERLDISLPLTVRFDAVELWARRPQDVASWYQFARVLLSGAPEA